MDEGIYRAAVPAVGMATDLKHKTRLQTRGSLAGIGVALAVYGVATALLLYRAPAIVGEKWAWAAILLVPVLTILVAALRTGTALSLVLVYAFASASLMAAQGYRLGWGEITQAEYVLSHFATVFFMAGSVALVAQIRSLQQRFERTQELVQRYVSEDEVTGLLTPQAFESAASRELSRSYRTSRPFLLLAIDLSDYFRPGRGSKAVGMAERMLGEILCAQTRGDQDLWTMWDEDVYLGLLVETGEQAVEPALERVLSRIAQAPEFAGAAVVDSARFGIATYPDDGYSLDALLELATTDLVTQEGLRARVGESTSNRTLSPATQAVG